MTMLTRAQAAERIRQLRPIITDCTGDLNDAERAGLLQALADEFRADAVERTSERVAAVESIPTCDLDSAYASIPPLNPPRDLEEIERRAKAEKVAETFGTLRHG